MNMEQATRELERLKVAWSSTKAKRHLLTRTTLLNKYQKAAGHAGNHVLKESGIYADDTILEIGSGGGAFKKILEASPDYRETQLIQTDISVQRTWV